MRRQVLKRYAVWNLGVSLALNMAMCSAQSAPNGTPFTGSELAPGTSVMGRHAFIEYHAGNAPLVISVPHGGNERPASIPDRTMGTQGHHDVQTIEMAKDISDAFFELTGRYPHVIVNRLDRTKLDANRELYDAAQDDSLASMAWEDFHAFIDTAKAIATREYGKGLYIDLHGHRHRTQRTEFGYLLVAGDLALSDDSLRRPAMAGMSSLRFLATRPEHSLDALVRGDQSLGALMEQNGYPSTPSPKHPTTDGTPYFSGGYNVEVHGSRDSGLIDGVQVEVPTSVRESEFKRISYGRALTRSLIAFLELQYSFSLARMK
jgi:hypothetical protein